MKMLGRLVRFLLTLVLLVILAAAGVVGWLTAVEYRPEAA